MTSRIRATHRTYFGRIYVERVILLTCCLLNVIGGAQVCGSYLFDSDFVFHHEFLPNTTKEGPTEVQLQDADVLQDKGKLGLESLDKLGRVDLINKRVIVLKSLNFISHLLSIDN